MQFYSKNIAKNMVIHKNMFSKQNVLFNYWNIILLNWILIVMIKNKVLFLMYK